MFKDLFIPAVLALLLFLLINPFDWWMNSVVYMGIVAGVLILFGLFALFVWQEKPRDEREAMHASFAGRTAYLFGGAVLVVGIAAQSFEHAIDPWLPVTLLMMILGKMLSLTWSRSRN